MKNTKNLPAIVSENSLTLYLREINNIPSLSKEEEFMLAKAYLEQHDLEAAHKLVKSHLKLVAKIAMRYRSYGLPVNELISEGNIGLMQAVKKFDPDLGHRLSTYSMWWIKAAIQEYVLKSWSLVKIGTTAAQKKLFFSLGKIKHKIINLYSRQLNDSDYIGIASELGVTVKEVNDMQQRLSGPDISLNTTLNKEDGNTGEMIELIPESKVSQEEKLSIKQISFNKKAILSQALNTLNDREVRILTARKLNDSPATLDTLSSEYNISKERIRQIENKAFEKIQSYVLNHITDDGQIKIVNS